MEGIFLGHYISSRIQVDPAKIEVISTFPTAEKKKYVRSFLGHTSYYMRCIKYFSWIATLLYNLLKMDFDFSWNSVYEKSLQQLEEVLTTMSYPHI